MTNRYTLFAALFAATVTTVQLHSHCQMPCGIYHDQMIYDKIDEYFETMVKAVTAMHNNDFKTVQDRNQFMRWVITKEKMSDEMAQVLMYYFLQQKVKPGNDDDTQDLVKSIHKMLFLLVQIKQNADVKIVKEFGKEWDHFKELFHPEMECRMVMHSEAAKSLKELEDAQDAKAASQAAEPKKEAAPAPAAPKGK